MKELVEIQSKLAVPKERRNDFGKYNYRSAEDILKAVKPLLSYHGCTLLLSDEVKEVGSEYTYNAQDTKKGTSSLYNGTRIYVEATATLINSEGERVSVKGLAREEVVKTGMDAAQITGAASSYARKYALNGLFAIDDGIEADTLNNNPQYTQPQEYTQEEIFQWYAKPAIEQAMVKEDLTRIWNDYHMLQGVKPFMEALTARRKALGIRNSKEK